MWIQWLPLRAAVRTLIWRLLHLRVEYLYQNLIDRILSNLIPKFSNHVIRIGRGYSGDRQTREGTSGPQKDLKLPQKAELFQTVPARVFSPPCCVLSPLILTHKAWMSTHPAVETGSPNWKIHPKKVYWSRSLFIIFAPPQKKIYTFTTESSNESSFSIQRHCWFMIL